MCPWAVRRQEEPGRLGAVHPRLQEVREAIHEEMTEAGEASTRLAAVGESPGDLLGALREGPEEAREGLGEDLVVRQEALEPLVVCRVVLGTKIES